MRGLGWALGQPRTSDRVFSKLKIENYKFKKELMQERIIFSLSTFPQIIRLFYAQTPHGVKDFTNVIATLDPEAPRR